MIIVRPTDSSVGHIELKEGLLQGKCNRAREGDTIPRIIYYAGLFYSCRARRGEVRQAEGQAWN